LGSGHDPRSDRGAPDRFPTLSPNGQRIAVEIADGPRSSSIWIYELGSGSLTRVSPGDADPIPVWSQPIDASAPPQSLVALLLLARCVRDARPIALQCSAVLCNATQANP
jgi:hypothetical protein